MESEAILWSKATLELVEAETRVTEADGGRAKASWGAKEADPF